MSISIFPKLDRVPSKYLNSLLKALTLIQKNHSNKVIGVVSGGFAPLHIGHIRMMKEAKSYCDYLLAIVNSDNFLLKKHGKIFMEENKRAEIVKAIRYVDDVILWDDGATNTIAVALEHIPCQILFQGGDRSSFENMDKTEVCVCKQNNIMLIGGIGGEEKADSSRLYLV